MKHIFPVVLIFLLIISCNDELDQFFNEPRVEVQFFNIDSLVKVDDSLKVISDSILFLADSISTWNDSINTLNDSISNLTVLIDAGASEHESTKILLESYLTTITTNLTIYVKLDSTLDVNNDVLTNVKSDIESGKVLLSRLENMRNGRSLSYTDSATSYFIPLSMTEDSSAFLIEIDGITYDLEFEYMRTNEEDEKSRIVVTAFDVALKRHTFDSASVICKTDLCENEDVSVQVYF